MTMFRIAAALCFLAVALGAFGAHSLKSTLETRGMLDLWNKAVFYHFIHAIALLVRLKLMRGKDSDEILPIRWQDNYFMLLPNESRQIGARYLTADTQGKTPSVSVDCFNNGRS